MCDGKIKILDVQGFQLKNKGFIPKELAFFDGVKLSHYVFKPPCSFLYLSAEDRKNSLVKWLYKY